jgi:hypothetical protein
MYRKLASTNLFMVTLTMLVAAITLLAAAPGRAQTYDPRYPVCLQTYGRDGNYIACGYTSLTQCKLSASGRAAQCLTNPYFAARGRRR